MSSHLKIIEELENLNEVQSKIIRALSMRLAELGDVETCQDEIRKADEIYKRVLGGYIDDLPFK